MFFVLGCALFGVVDGGLWNEGSETDFCLQRGRQAIELFLIAYRSRA